MEISPQQLESCVDRARRRWPSVEVSPEIFGRRLADCAADGAALAALQIEDLYLATACAAGDPAALAELERAYGDQIRLGLSRVGLDPDEREEVKQRQRDKLFVRQGERPPRIALYSGRGPLGRWLQVAVMREALNFRRATRREQSGEVSILERAVALEQDQELAYFKKLYRAEFKSAFAEALKGLEPRDRTLLRYKLLDDLAIDQIGAVFGVHRATAARWLERVRARLLEATRDSLVGRLRLEANDFDSILRLIHSELDVSIHRLLQEEETSAPDPE